MLAKVGGVAVTGIGCRFPGGVRSAAGMADFLRAGGDGIVDIPLDRWNTERFHDPIPGRPFKTVARRAGLIEGIDRFDAGFFGIPAIEAAAMDPQQRVILQTAWEALEDAGLGDDPEIRRRTGVFIGISTNDHCDGLVSRLEMTPPSPFSALGFSKSIAANRISHALDLGGPSMAIDTACSSSLVALHLGVQAIEAGDCDVALVGGVNIIIQPNVFLAFSAASMLSPDGRCKAFDAAADGFVRGEGAGVVVLRRTADARADGDRIYATVLATGLNQDGRTRGITMPSPEAQAALAQDACRRAGVSPADICYVEAHGTGTAVGDPIEASALGRVYGAGRDAPVPIGSIKTNIGHLEAGAGVAGLIKLAMVLSRRSIPASLHFDTPNPAIDFDALGLEVATRNIPLTGGGPHGLCGAINSFGFGGTNAHAILGEPPRAHAAQTAADPLAPLVVSARSPNALRANARALRDTLATEGADLPVIARAALRRRVQHPLRLAAAGADTGAMIGALDGFLATGDASGAGWVSAEAPSTPRAGPVFVYSGQGPQWWAMGRELYAALPEFRAVIDACAAQQDAFGGWPLLAEFLADEADSRMHETAVAQPCIFALQAGLTTVLRSRGVVPSAVIGHSVGEVAAAWASGALNLGQACRVIYERGVAMDLSLDGGAMISLRMSPEDAAALPAVADGRLEIAAMNGRRTTVLSGFADDVATLERDLRAMGLAGRRLPVKYAFHSRLMDPSRDQVMDALGAITPGETTVPLFSTVTGGPVRGSDLTAAYWWRNIRRPVRFFRAVEGLIARGRDTFVEIGAQPVLTGDIRQTLRSVGHGRSGLVVDTLRRGKPEAEALQSTLGALHCHGAVQDVAADGPTPQISLPSYGWDEDVCWMEAAGSLRLRTGPLEHPFLSIEVPANDPTWRTPLEPRLFPMLADHVLKSRVVVPATFFVEMALAGARAVAGPAAAARGDALIIRNLRLERFLPHTPGAAAFMQLSVSDGAFRVTSARDEPAPEFLDHAVGAVSSRKLDRPAPIDRAAILARCRTVIDVDKAYAEISGNGLELGPSFTTMKGAWAGRRESLSRVEIDPAHHPEADGLILAPQLFDAVGHILGMGDEDLLPGVRAQFYAPSRYDEIRVHAPAGTAAWVWMKVRASGPFRIYVDAVLFDDDGAVLVEATGFELICMEALPADAGSAPDRRHHKIAWRRDRDWAPSDASWTAAAAIEGLGLPADPAPDAATPDAVWAALADQDAWTEAVAAEWRGALRAAPDASAPMALLAHVGGAWPALRADPAAPGALLTEMITARYLAVALRDDPGLAGLATLCAGLRAGAPDGRRLSVLDLTFDYGATAATLAQALGRDGRVVSVYHGEAMVTAASETLSGAVRFVAWEDLAAEAARFDLILCDPHACAPDRMAAIAAMAPALAAPGAARADRGARGGFLGGLADLRRAADAGAALALSAATGDASWRPVRALDARTPAAAVPPGAALAVIGDGPLAEALAGALAARAITGHGDALQALLAEMAADGRPLRVVDVRPAAAQDESADLGDLGLSIIGDMAAAAQDLAAAMRPTARLHYTVVMRGAYGAVPGEDGDPAQAAATGFVRSLGAALPDLACRMIDLSPEPHPDEIAALARQILASGDGEDLVALRGDARHLARIAPSRRARVPLAAEPSRMVRLVSRAPGVLDRLALADGPRMAPGPGQLEIAVEAVALNFRDVLKALKLYPADAPDAAMLGDECVGRVARVGPGVTAFKPGDRVMASATGCIASHAVTDQGRVMPLPAGMGPEAAGVIVPFMTAWRALIDAGRLRAGERVLIHAGAGGVGLAAIQVAQAMGAEVYATAGSPLKRAFLRNLGVAHTFDSRSAAFVDGVMAATGGEGVDIVVNSLSGDLLQASFETLRGGGRFIELGKRDIEDDTQIGLRHFRRGLSYVALDLSQDASPEAFAAVMAEIGSRLESGVLRPLPYRSFDLTEAVDAFAMMSRGAHIGKIILTVDPGRLTVPPSTHPAPAVDPNGAYVVAGGLRGFGMRLGRWLVARGARKLALVGLSGAVPDDQQDHLTWMRDQGAEVLILRADLGNRAAVADMLGAVRGAFGPIAGVVHAAATYSDRLIQDETPDNLARVYRPKAAAAWALHEETLGDPVSMFVMCSSVSAILGGVGQIGYAAANAFLDGLARRRAALGLPATVVSLDPISDTGYITRNRRIADYLRGLGFEGVASADILTSIEIALADDRPETIVTGLNWTTWSQMSAGAGTMPLLAEVRTVAAAQGAVGGGVRDRIIAAPPAEQLPEAVAYLRTEIAKILRRPEDRIDADVSLEALGIDSLNMVELVLRMESELAVSLPSSLAMMSPTLMTIAALVVQQLTLGGITDAGVESAAPGAGSAQRRASVETMHADAALAEALDFGRLDLLPGPGAPLRDVLVTGATGVVGAMLVADLLRRGEARIICLVRGDDDAAATARLVGAVQARDPGLSDGAITARCRVLAADMALPLFGLAPDVHDALAREVGDVFHLAATVNHIMPYSVLRGPNVLGSLEILKFATECRVKRVHFASSIAVYALGDLPADRVMPEAARPRHPGGIDSPYAQTKWVAEAMATHAASCGLPVAIHRIGIVVEEDGDALMDEETLVWRLLEANLAIGGAPDVTVPLYLVGSRFVAQAMHEVARHEQLPPGPFALVGADGGSLQRVAGRLGAHVPDLAPMPMRAWVERLFAAGWAEADSPLAPYIQMAGIGAQMEAQTEALIVGLSELPDRFDRSNLLAALAGSGVEDVDVERFLDRAADILAAKFPRAAAEDRS